MCTSNCNSVNSHKLVSHIAIVIVITHQIPSTALSPPCLYPAQSLSNVLHPNQLQHLPALAENSKAPISETSRPLTLVIVNLHTKLLVTKSTSQDHRSRHHLPVQLTLFHAHYQDGQSPLLLLISGISTTSPYFYLHHSASKNQTKSKRFLTIYFHDFPVLFLSYNLWSRKELKVHSTPFPQSGPRVS